MLSVSNVEALKVTLKIATRKQGGVVPALHMARSTAPSLGKTQTAMPLAQSGACL